MRNDLPKAAASYTPIVRQNSVNRHWSDMRHTLLLILFSIAIDCFAQDSLKYSHKNIGFGADIAISPACPVAS